MHIPRLYYPFELHVDQEIALPPDRQHHLRDVLRQQVGDQVVVFNGEGGEYRTQIVSMSKRELILAVEAFVELNNESPVHLHLLQAVLSQEKLTWIVQKAVELGVSEITPVTTDFSNVKLSPDRQQKRLEQLTRVMIAACEQCGRDRLPTLNPIQALDKVLPNLSGQVIACHPKSSGDLQELDKPASLNVLIGPEGGFSPAEEQLFSKQGVMRIALSPRILRSETAAICAISLLQFQFGDL